MNRNRLETEQRILNHYFPALRFQTRPVRGVLGPLKTNSGQQYTLWVRTDRFPDSPPPVYVLRPHLKAFCGSDLADYGASSSYHTLTPDSHGHPQVCHHSSSMWHPKLTIYHAVLKARIWLEAYERHLQTGRPIDRWLEHM
jgi:hypothetical protein